MNPSMPYCISGIRSTNYNTRQIQVYAYINYLSQSIGVIHLDRKFPKVFLQAKFQGSTSRSVKEDIDKTAKKEKEREQ